jgi:hypothetical protein
MHAQEEDEANDQKRHHGPAGHDGTALNQPEGAGNPPASRRLERQAQAARAPGTVEFAAT